MDIDDEALAMEFLAGRFEQHGDEISFKRLKPGSSREKQAQQALVRLLRSKLPLSEMIRWRIAGLLDPEHQFENRKLVIAFRKKGHDQRFFDIQFGPFQQDPFPTLARLYEFLGEFGRGGYVGNRLLAGL